MHNKGPSLRRFKTVNVTISQDKRKMLRQRKTAMLRRAKSCENLVEALDQLNETAGRGRWETQSSTDTSPCNCTRKLQRSRPQQEPARDTSTSVAPTEEPTSSSCANRWDCDNTQRTRNSNCQASTPTPTDGRRPRRRCNQNLRKDTSLSPPRMPRRSTSSDMTNPSHVGSVRAA